MARLLVGPDHKVLMPTAAILGAIFVLLCDGLARTAAAPLEIPIGVVTALFGAPFFLYLLRRKKSQIITEV
jgi:iron complex transport system permease protein